MPEFHIALVRYIELERQVTVEATDNDEAWDKAYALRTSPDSEFTEQVQARRTDVAWVEETIGSVTEQYAAYLADPERDSEEGPESIEEA